MQIFLSWSGDQSRALADAFREYLPLVIQSAVPWFSPEDIDKGARWLSELGAQLQKQSIGIVCVTPDNMNSPWLLFEAGALSKALEAAWVCPVLFALEPTDVKGPLAQFQATRATKSDIRRLLSTVNKRLDSPLPEAHLDTLHEALWPQFEARLNAIPSARADNAIITQRSPNDLLNEVLDRIRALERHLIPPVETSPIRQIADAIARIETVQAQGSLFGGSPPPSMGKIQARLEEASQRLAEIDRELAAIGWAADASKAKVLSTEQERLQQRVRSYTYEITRRLHKLRKGGTLP